MQLKGGGKSKKDKKSKHKGDKGSEKSMNLDGHYSSQSSTQEEDDYVFKSASNCLAKKVQVTLVGKICQCGYKSTFANHFIGQTCVNCL